MSTGTNLLPKGLRFVERTEPINVEINRADPDGPAFIVEVARISREKFSELVARNRVSGNIDPNSKAAKKADARFQESFCRKAIIGWRGLTTENLRELLPHVNIEIDEDEGADASEYESGNKEIPYSHELAVFLYRKTWGDDFGEPIFRALKTGSEEDQDREEELGND